MKVTGQKIFNPITITLETEEEFGIFWYGIENILRQMSSNNIHSSPEFRRLLIEISNRFTKL